MCLEEVDIKDGKDVSASGVTEDSNISKLKENTCLVEKTNPDPKKRRKLHWGLDTKERWERKANM
ncbi:putative protein FAM204A [Cocos nucifera]|uniref:Uncharacterized protein n=1 Tax=Cocos nucifera TaxID=13894 RepID=A0A8K0IC13_COCNU|nr:putative protein FAM204A [Cocos nucifera]